MPPKIEIELVESPHLPQRADSNLKQNFGSVGDDHEPEEARRTWWQSLARLLKTPGSAPQIITAAILAIAIGIVVSTQAPSVPESARVILSIPGDLWLRCLNAVVLPLIVCSMLLSVRRLRDLADGGVLVKWTVGYYVVTTLLSVMLSCILMGCLWARLYSPVEGAMLDLDDSGDGLPDTSERPVHGVVLDMFRSFIPSNIISALANGELLAVIITAVVVGYLVESSASPIIRVAEELERMVSRVVTFLIQVAPVGVFFLILPNLMKLDIAEIGTNLGLLIAATLSTMLIHVVVILPIIFYCFTKMNPFIYWARISPAWITAWGCASSAATLSVTLQCAKARGIPSTIYKFTCPLGCLINMDGTAIYLPAAVEFLAATQGITLGPVDYIIVALLSTMGAIGVSPIPSASLVLSVMIARSVDVQVTGMFAVIVSIDWFLDRFRTAINVSGDLFASMIIYKATGIEDNNGGEDDVGEDFVTTDVRMPPGDASCRV